MRKPPRIKPRKPKPTLQTIEASTSRTTEKRLNKATELARQEKSNTSSVFVSTWKDFWAFAGPILSVLGVAAYWWPSVTISTGVNLDPSQDFQTQFIVTNTGKVAVHDLSFSCSLIGNQGSIGSLGGSPSTLARIDVLKSGEPASRGCFTKSLEVDGPMLKVEVAYLWPLINAGANSTAYFSVKKGPSGAYLVPEAAPNPEPPTLLKYRN